uniref:Uncharacterized protein n=1 Tax=Anthurium amnicola TaxID=1678845 RepID=A0A1D1Y936_9ARAE
MSLDQNRTNTTCSMKFPNENLLVFDEMPHLADDHLDAALEVELPAAGTVGIVNGDEGGEDVDEAGDDGRHERVIAAEADGLEEERGVEHDNVDAGELREEGDEEGHCELGPVPALQDVPPGVLHLPGLIARGHEVLELRVDGIGATDLAEHLTGLFGLAAVHEGVGSVREEKGAKGDDGSRHAGAAQAEAPPPPTLDPGCAIVHHVGH